MWVCHQVENEWMRQAKHALFNEKDRSAKEECVCVANLAIKLSSAGQAHVAPPPQNFIIKQK